MLILERQQMIIELLKQHNSLTVTDMAKLCSVSKETLRRDLRVLEKKGMICRSHGGAMLTELFSHEPIVPPILNTSKPSFRQKILVNAEIKTRIARKALQFVNNADRIALDSSSSCWFLSRQLPNVDMTVITHSINVVQTLAAKSQIQIFVLGGAYFAKNEDMVGTLTEKMLAEFKIDTLFISCDGLDFDNGLSDNNEYHARLKKQMILTARKVIVLADSSKFNQNAFAKICNLGDIDVLITDKKIDKLLQKEMDWHSVNVVIA
ncbi:MAG: DeoR/GlpR transcriptional regulator [Gilliamella sp.]|uniref:DeoR/GlpR family DNA-binding transcription regulator n=1 Tax=Gilliamella sp. TaxID=1891236 RepID=UPI00262FFD8D|nr:DeoR/GlpR family DNA-binding transcription regulator [Gilliamella sp.]MCO6553157.1 DeoR/GlpR transcriptional regulator [Gilliamella sp.]